MSKLNKDQLRAKMQANSPTTNRTATAVPLTDLTGAKANGQTVQTPATPLKGVSKRKRAKDGVKNTSRYSFKSTAELKNHERAVLEHQLATGKKLVRVQ